jgi:hypothetical protein
MILRNRFQLALHRLRSSDWERFERLCSAFLAVEFPQIRTTASPGGDRGRDAELFTYSDSPNVLFQFSVSQDWEGKINDTLRRIKDEFPETRQMIFLFNQEIGAQGDTIRAKVFSAGLGIDIRDQSWFVERANLDEGRRAAAEELALAVVDPYLRESGVISNAPGLTGQEARTALVYLEMQARDESASKGLTKSCFEALVKCALRGTSAENRKRRDEVQNHIQGLLPQHTASQLNPLIDSALKRLSKSVIKHWGKLDQFHLSFDEVQRTQDRVAGLALLSQAFADDVTDVLRSDAKLVETQYEEIIGLAREIIERYFFKLGEEFAQCLVGKLDVPLHEDVLNTVILERIPAGRPYIGATWKIFLEKLLMQILRTPSSATTELLRLLSTSYTLFAFLSEVPDVQKATKRLFEHGTIWLDTTALLPLVAERAFSDEMRPFTDLMVQLQRAGTKLVVTRGVVEEVERHLNLCTHYLRTSNWVGRIPYVFARYKLAGKQSSGFQSWVEHFMGAQRPLDDLADYFAEVAQIEVNEIPSLEKIDNDVVTAVRNYWHDVQENRRRNEGGMNINAYRLAEHDSENYLAALAQRRQQPGGSVLGYSNWLLTLDSAAWALLNKVEYEVKQKVRHAPVISLDFLFKYLAFGPRRDRIDTTGNGSARIFTQSVYESVPDDLIEVAESVRSKSVGLSERLIQRRIRDELDKQRMSAGEMQRAGLEAPGVSMGAA